MSLIQPIWVRIFGWYLVKLLVTMRENIPYDHSKIMSTYPEWCSKIDSKHWSKPFAALSLSHHGSLLHLMWDYRCQFVRVTTCHLYGWLKASQWSDWLWDQKENINMSTIDWLTNVEQLRSVFLAVRAIITSTLQSWINDDIKPCP